MTTDKFSSLTVEQSAFRWSQTTGATWNCYFHCPFSVTMRLVVRFVRSTRSSPNFPSCTSKLVNGRKRQTLDQQQTTDDIYTLESDCAKTLICSLPDGAYHIDNLSKATLWPTNLWLLAVNCVKNDRKWIIYKRPDWNKLKKKKEKQEAIRERPNLHVFRESIIVTSYLISFWSYTQTHIHTHTQTAIKILLHIFFLCGGVTTIATIKVIYF